MNWNSLNTLRLRPNLATGISGLATNGRFLRENYSFPIKSRRDGLSPGQQDRVVALL
jgi:hypothetical protein